LSLLFFRETLETLETPETLCTLFAISRVHFILYYYLSVFLFHAHTTTCNKKR
jgi:hypothetical protein